MLLFLRNKWFVFIFPIYFIPNNLFPCYITPLIVPWNKSFKFPKTNIFKCSFDTFFIFVPSQQMIFVYVPNIFCSNSCIPSQLYFLKCSLATYMHLFIGNISFKFFFSFCSFGTNVFCLCSRYVLFQTICSLGTNHLSVPLLHFFFYFYSFGNKWFLFMSMMYFVPTNLFPSNFIFLKCMHLFIWNKSFKFSKTNIFKCSFLLHYLIFVPSQQMIYLCS